VKYHSVKTVGPDAKLSEFAARSMGIDFCLETKCDYYLSLDGEAHLDNPRTVKLLIGQNRNVIAPMLVRPFKAWSNFWGALNNEGYLLSYWYSSFQNKLCLFSFRYIEI
jgi:procollagen-lysine,2-oxoglutarate 5-dioxygenase